MADIKISKVTTIISIKNWNSYQGVDNKTDNRIHNRIPTNKNVKNGIEELAFSLIESIKKESSLYAIINKYISALGEEKLFIILTDCDNRWNRFVNENKLAAYLETCARNNGQLTNHIPEIKEGTPGWM